MTDTRSLGEKYRLTPSQLNLLLQKLIDDEKKLGSSVTEKKLIISNPRTACQEVTYHVIEKNFQQNGKKITKKIVIFPVCKDSRQKNNESELVFIRDLLAQYRLGNKQNDCVLLLPLFQCRGFLYLPHSIPKAKRRHIVLVEVELNTMQINVHDSQNLLLTKIYPDAIADFSSEEGFKYNPAENYHSYNTQSGNIICGYRVHESVASILKNGNSQQLVSINSAILDEYKPDKTAYLKKFIPDYEAFIEKQRQKMAETSSVEMEFVEIMPDHQLRKCEETLLPLTEEEREEDEKILMSFEFEDFNEEPEKSIALIPFEMDDFDEPKPTKTKILMNYSFSKDEKRKTEQLLVEIPECGPASNPIHISKKNSSIDLTCRSNSLGNNGFFSKRKSVSCSNEMKAIFVK